MELDAGDMLAAPHVEAMREAADPRARRRTYAALDLGTNNCRLLIARQTHGGFYVVDSFSRVVRLGEGLLASGRLSDASQDRALAALAVCAGKIRRREVTLARSVATEACRRASNGAKFIERVYEETGIALDVITPAEEARLAVLGCQALIEPKVADAIVFDIGGGSTELVLVRPGAGGQAQVRAWVSLPWGVISLAETEPMGIATREGRLDAYARSHTRVSQALGAFAARIAPMLGGRMPQLLGTSGTVTTLAALQMGLPAYDRTVVDGCYVPAQAMREIGTDARGQIGGRARAAAHNRHRPCGPDRCRLRDPRVDPRGLPDRTAAHRGSRHPRGYLAHPDRARWRLAGDRAARAVPGRASAARSARGPRGSAALRAAPRRAC